MIVRIMEDRAPDYENGTLTPGINRSNHRELIRFEAEDGQELYGFFASSGQARQPRGVVVFAHEFGSSAESCFRYCKPLIEGGFDVFSFDFRGHGHSPSQCGYKPMQWPTGREKSDMAAAIIRKGSPIPLQHSTPTPAPAYAPVYSPSVADRSG